MGGGGGGNYRDIVLNNYILHDTNLATYMYAVLSFPLPLPHFPAGGFAGGSACAQN